MSNTIQITIPASDDDIRDELIARLSAVDFDAFEEKKDELLAFIDEKKFETEVLNNIVSGYNVSYTKTTIEEQNWNAIWESSFEPVIVEDFCAIRAEFHPPFHNIKHEIIITPKMSFGTGHHATTYLMISAMSQMNFTGKRVADFGTGTGVLAILSEKLGAEYVWAVDNDDWSIDNSKENIARNSCRNIKIEKAYGFYPTEHFDIILANINKNVILQNAESLVLGLNAKGQLLLSGLLKEDETDIVSAFKQKNWHPLYVSERMNWISILLEKR